MSCDFLSLLFFISGGAGGKGTWGKLTEVYDEGGLTRDAKDPNYDSNDEDVSRLLSSLLHGLLSKLLSLLHEFTE